jgi:hypothetical protein
MTDTEKTDSYKTEFRKLMDTYAGFQMAIVLLIATKASNVFGAGYVISLLAISIPSTLALGIVARITDKDEARYPQSLSGPCYLLTFIPSIIALSILLYPVSGFAAFAFPFMCVIWFYLIIKNAKEKNAV